MESNDSPEIPDRGETSEETGLPFGPKERSVREDFESIQYKWKDQKARNKTKEKPEIDTFVEVTSYDKPCWLGSILFTSRITPGITSQVIRTSHSKTSLSRTEHTTITNTQYRFLKIVSSILPLCHWIAHTARTCRHRWPFNFRSKLAIPQLQQKCQNTQEVNNERFFMSTRQNNVRIFGIRCFSLTKRQTDKQI